jgi:hypothetical protein
MKSHLIILLGLLCSIAHGESGLIEHTTGVFNPNGIEVLFEIPKSKETNYIKIYKTVPNNFSDSTISNLLVLGKLSETNKTTPFEKRDKTARCWISEENKSNMQIIPTVGMVDLRVQRPDKIGAEGDLVPPVDELKVRASELLSQLFGISTNDVECRNGVPYVTCCESKMTSYNKEQKKRVSCISFRNLFFHRMIDGHLFHTADFPAFIEFVDYGKITKLQLYWPKLELISTIPHPSIESLKEMVSKGQARTSADLDSPTKLVLNDVDYYYVEKRTVGQTLYYPYMRLSGTLYNATTNNPVYLFCDVPEKK